jgi:hypothetical protein
MAKRLVTCSLIVALAAGLGVSTTAEAKSCRARCRRAAALCAARHCADFRGPVRRGCRRGFKITLINACKVAPDGNVCEQTQAENCAN